MPRCCDVKGNNAYIFPGVGLAAVACGATRITDLDMYIAAKALAEAVPTVSSSRVKTKCERPWALDLMRVCSLRAKPGLHDNRRMLLTLLPSNSLEIGASIVPLTLDEN